MLNVLILSFIGAFIFTIVTSGIGLIIHRDTYIDFDERVKYMIASFIIDFVYMMLFLYVSCLELTIFVVLRWMWPILLVDIFILLMLGNDEYEIKSTCALALLSGVICLSVIFAPVQNLIFSHDMKNVDISYAVTSDEILAKIDLKIDNSVYNRDRYNVESPEMRLVNGKYIAVYHIVDAEAHNGSSNAEYIPGYAIQEKGKLPEIVPCRIYFDTSFVNRKDALRTIRRKYKTEVIGNHKFDIDDDGNPYEIFEYRENLYFSNGNDYGLIILNLNDGTSEKYPVLEKQIPEWVDFETTYPR